MFRKIKNLAEALNSRLYRIEKVENLPNNRVRFTMVRRNWLSFCCPRVIQFDTTRSQVTKLRNEGFAV